MGSACVYLHVKISPVRVSNSDDLIVRESSVRKESYLFFFYGRIRSNLLVTSSGCLRNHKPTNSSDEISSVLHLLFAKFNNGFLTQNARKCIVARSDFMSDINLRLIHPLSVK